MTPSERLCGVNQSEARAVLRGRVVILAPCSAARERFGAVSACAPHRQAARATRCLTQIEVAPRYFRAEQHRWRESQPAAGHRTGLPLSPCINGPPETSRQNLRLFVSKKILLHCISSVCHGLQEPCGVQHENFCFKKYYKVINPKTLSIFKNGRDSYQT